MEEITLKEKAEFIEQIDSLEEVKAMTIYYLIEKAKEENGKYCTEIVMKDLFKHDYLLSLIKDMLSYMDIDIKVNNTQEHRRIALFIHISCDDTLRVTFSPFLNEFIIFVKDAIKKAENAEISI